MAAFVSAAGQHQKRLSCSAGKSASSLCARSAVLPTNWRPRGSAAQGLYFKLVARISTMIGILVCATPTWLLHKHEVAPCACKGRHDSDLVCSSEQLSPQCGTGLELMADEPAEAATKRTVDAIMTAETGHVEGLRQRLLHVAGLRTQLCIQPTRVTNSMVAER